ncbi:MAG: Fic family protein, partial [Deltaproteobacteria bacterium]|nr:Fic family protein [Deltaproteobacteria bacterium]
MKIFDYAELPKTLLTPDIVFMLTSIHEHKGKQELYIEAHADALTTLFEIAKVESVGASNRIEGISATDKRLTELVLDNSAPRNRAEQEIAGYRDVLATINESYDYIQPRPNIILQLHRRLYVFTRSSIGGVYKQSDNYIAETDEQGEKKIIFRPTPAFLTPEAMDRLCAAFDESLRQDELDPLLLIPMFVLDFLRVHPFTDGNGRLSRLLTLLLLYRAGYIVGKFVSLEKLIENDKDAYYQALRESSANWRDNASDYIPFTRYFLGALLKAGDAFEERVEYLGSKGMSEPD